MSSFGLAVFGLIDKKNQDVFKVAKEYVGDSGVVFKTKAQNHGYVIEK